MSLIRLIKLTWPAFLFFCFVLFYLTVLAIYSTKSDEKKQTIMGTTSTVDCGNNFIKMDEFVLGIKQNDSRILNYIRENHVTPPAASTKPYNLEKPGIDPSQGQSKVVKEILGEIRNGFFVESGAHDGEYISNTLAFEKDYNWTGILIDPSPTELPNLRAKNRKAWIVDVCLSPGGFPINLEFMNRIEYTLANKLGHVEPGDRQWTQYRVQCFPIYSILSALNVTLVDYWSLDVEGVELDVLKNFPWKDGGILIKVISVEYNLIPEGKVALVKYMTQQGYQVYTEVYHDVIFVHESI